MPRALPVSAPRSEMDWGGAGYVEPAAVAKKMLAEREAINSRTKLTWSKDSPPQYPTDRMIGDVNLSAPSIRFGTGRPGKYYYLQNCDFYLGNGEKTTIEEIAGLEAMDPLGAVTMAVLRKAEEIFLRDAAKRDAQLCKHCLRYRSKNNDDYLKHCVVEHPDVVLSANAEVRAPASVKSEPGKTTFTYADNPLTCCGKTFKDARGLGAHKRFAKTNHGA